MKIILLPTTYTEDSPESRKESGLKYQKVYTQEYVTDLIEEIEELKDGLIGAINDAKNRGTQRLGIAMVKKANKMLNEWADKILEERMKS